MKKVLLSLAVLASVALVSCNDGKKGSDSDSMAAPATEETTPAPTGEEAPVEGEEATADAPKTEEATATEAAATEATDAKADAAKADAAATDANANADAPAEAPAEPQK